MAEERKIKKTNRCAQCGGPAPKDEDYCSICKRRVKLGILDGKGGIKNPSMVAG